MVQFDYDQHILDLWTLGYIYTLNYGLKKCPRSILFDYFKLSKLTPISAGKVRHEAEVFRRIIRNMMLNVKLKV